MAYDIDIAGRGGALIYRRSNERMYWVPGYGKEAVRPSVTFVLVNRSADNA